MTVKVTDYKFGVSDHTNTDLANLNDEEFYEKKLLQTISVLAKAAELTRPTIIEMERIEELKKSSPKIKTVSTSNSATIISPIIINRTVLSSLEFSLLLIQFTYIESFLNIISDCTIRKNNRTNVLLNAELEFLMEKKSTYKNGGVKTSPLFVNIEVKAKEYCRLFAKANDDSFSLDISKHYWENFIEAKKIRNSITHPRGEVIDQIETSTLFEIAEFIYWFTDQMFELIVRYTNFKHYRIIENYSYMLLYNINYMNGGDTSRITEQIKRHQEIVELN